jgi:hypothetical protein
VVLRLGVVCVLWFLQPPELPPLRLPAAKRLVAIGDLHGDLDKVGVLKENELCGMGAPFCAAVEVQPCKRWSEVYAR